MAISKPTLYYFHDSMCAWCWAFREQWQLLCENLPQNIDSNLILGGLASDTDEPMPIELQQSIQGYWKRIQSEFNIPFNFDFWQKCQPIRSTWIACRAVIAASYQGSEVAMIQAIQKAYYLQARNPSEAETLTQIAIEIGLDGEQFSRELNSESTQRELDKQMVFGQACGVRGFPSLRLIIEDRCIVIPIAIDDYQVSLDRIVNSL